MYAIFKFKKAQIQMLEAVYHNDLISRQTLIKRDNISLEMPNEAVYLLIEGDEKAIDRARELLSDAEEIRDEQRTSIYKKFKDQDESTLAGLNTIFG